MEARRIEIDGIAWLAWLSGGGAYGTGIIGNGVVEAVHFATADAPTTPVYEALLPAGAFEDLFDNELTHVFRSARRVVEMSEAPARPATRRLADQS